MKKELICLILGHVLDPKWPRYYFGERLQCMRCGKEITKFCKHYFSSHDFSHRK